MKEYLIIDLTFIAIMFVVMGIFLFILRILGVI